MTFLCTQVGSGVVAGISRDQLNARGGWKSNAVDLYIQDKPGIAFSGKLLRRL